MSLTSSLLKKRWLLLVPLVLVLTVVGVTRCQSNRHAVKPHRGPIVEAVYGLGTVTSSKTFQLKIGVTSSVTKLFVAEGDFVKQGAPLVAIESRTAPFTAPFTGTVTSIPLKVGETIFPQAKIIAMQDLTDRYLLVSLEQQGALRVRPGQTAQISFESLRGEKYVGVVKSVFPSFGTGDDESRSADFMVHIQIDKMPPAIIPGMTADVAVEVAQRADALLIPANAVIAGYVQAIRDGKRQRLAVKVGTVDGEWAEITDDSLRADDRVIVPKR